MKKKYGTLSFSYFFYKREIVNNRCSDDVLPWSQEGPFLETK
jgi:hypothetical protein